jgi:hypothetical protein
LAAPASGKDLEGVQLKATFHRLFALRDAGPKLGEWFALCLLAIYPVSALAGTLNVASYSMFNGGTGDFSYTDATYTNCPCAPGTFLSGGTGELTDGYSPQTGWRESGGIGWVGWLLDDFSGILPSANPTVTFYFDNPITVDSVTVLFDNAQGDGFVAAPASISVDGTNYEVIPADIPGPQAFTISNLNITGTSVPMQFFQQGPANPWIMIGEVTFDGTATGTPEPSTPVLFVVGGVGLGLFRRLRSQTVGHIDRLEQNRSRAGWRRLSDTQGERRKIPRLPIQ